MMKLTFVFVAMCSVLGLVAAEETAVTQIKVLSLEPTVLFRKREPLAQVARMTVMNASTRTVRLVAVVSTASGAREETESFELAPNQSTVDVLIPDVAQATPVKIELKQGSTVVGTHEQVWQPQRKWKVFIVKSSHEDIGYENYIFKKQREIAEFIDLGQEQSSPKSVAGNISMTGKRESSPFHYTMESILFQRNYIEERGEKAWRSLVEKDLKTGNMSLMGAPSGVHSHWMDYEELARMTYAARRETKDRFGLDIKTFMIVDNPSLSWSGAQAVANAGFKYVARWGQGWRTAGKNDYATTKVPAIFWWQGPDGLSKVLFSWRSHYANGFWFGATGTYRHLVDVGAKNVSEVLRKVESGEMLGPYPYDALITPEYIDHDIPRFDMRVLPAWQEQYAYPEIHVSSPDAFFTYIEGQYGKSVPVLSGDLNNFSADYSSIDPVSQGWKRAASRLLPAAEGLGVLAMAQDPSFSLLPADVERIYTRMHDYDEHCWPTLPRVTDEQLFNASWVKNHEARRALDATQATFETAASALAKNIVSPGAGSIAVFNPLAHARSGLVETFGSATSVTDLRTGKKVTAETLGDGKMSFRAENIPAFGYALYQLETGTVAASPAAELQTDKLSIENAYYTVRFDAETGSVTSIVEKAKGKELIDQKAPYRANQLVYVHRNERESKTGFEYSPAKAARMESRVSGNRATFDVWIDDAKLGGTVRQTVTLHAGVKRVEFANHLESIDVMWSPRYEDRYCDNLFYAFPFAVEGGQIRAEYPGGVVRPYDDQLRWGSHDYLYANRWIDVSNAHGGVTLASREAGTFSLGEIRYNQLSIDYKPTKPWLFSYAWSNRMAGLLTLNAEDCNASFHYSLTSHDGDWNAGAATRHGWETGSPLLALPLASSNTGKWMEKQRSFLAIDKGNVQLTVLKAAGQAGRGFIARFVETSGKATEFEVDVSALSASEARVCDLVENDVGTVVVNGGKIRIPIRPFGFATVRLLSGEKPGEIKEVRAQTITDSSILLRWTGPVADGVGYNVYCSDDPDAPATVYSQVARTAANEFLQHGLSLATNYTFRVAAVSSGNIEGPLSEPIVVRTSSENKAPPAPVRELGVVRRAPDTLIVYWRKNPEPDVAFYRVFRGETPDFVIGDQKPHAILVANAYFLQVFRDTGLQPGKTYYYRIQSIDWSENLQQESPMASATTPKDRA